MEKKMNKNDVMAELDMCLLISSLMSKIGMYDYSKERHYWYFTQPTRAVSRYSAQG